ncbi:MAG: sel1 repeat family protein [Burkholderiales bacterium]|jgi:TPR repeat protein|nr:sel1 repeat family protein [Burkholderiales bacterium]
MPTFFGEEWLFNKRTQKMFFKQSCKAVITLSFALSVNAAKADLPITQTNQPEIKATEAQSSSMPQSSTERSDIYDVIPDGPDKQKRIKELEKQMLGTVGWRSGRYGVLTLNRGPRADRLYKLHKNLVDSDWWLLADMYINFDHGHKDILDLEEALRVLLAMHGQDSINKLNKIIESKNIAKEQKTLLYSKTRFVKDSMKFFKNGMETRYWSDVPEYRKDQEKSCKANEMSACAALGFLYEREGYRKKPSFLKARELYEKACAADEMLACFGLARLYDRGNGMKQDFLKAKKLYEKACAAHYAESCMNLAGVYYQGRGVEKNYSEAKAYYKKTCDLGNDRGCDGYAQLNERLD